MKTYLDCIPCFLRQCLDSSRNITDDVNVHERIVREMLYHIAELDFNRPPPSVSQHIYRKLRNITGENDPYFAVKRKFNEAVMSILPDLRDMINGDEYPLIAAARTSIAANVIDMGVKSELNKDSVLRALRESCSAPFYGNTTEFVKRVNAAQNILYLADNAGEIAADRLLIEILGPHRVTLAVRGKPVINDVTFDDAQYVGMHELVTIIDNGSDAPGTVLEDCSEDFRKHFYTADLIISKGQGNFETLNNVDRNIAFLFMVKCSVIAKHVGLPEGTHVLIHSSEKGFPEV